MRSREWIYDDRGNGCENENFGGKEDLQKDGASMCFGDREVSKERALMAVEEIQ